MPVNAKAAQRRRKSLPGLSRRKCQLGLIAAAAAAAHSFALAQNTDYWTASDGIYTVYANDTSTDNVGIVGFDIDVQGDGGAGVTSSYYYAPDGRGTVEYNGNTYHPESGFNILDGDGDDGVEITAMQNVIYGSTDNAFDDAKVIQGFGQSSGTDGSLSWTQTNVGALIAAGTYSGSGTLSVNVHRGAYVQVLSIVSGGQWSGPGDLTMAQVTGDTITV